jgi:formate dehydrogenase iron-sulfur subunit
MSGYSFLVDTSRCTGCRGCQAACKQWNQNPATRTSQQGTYQNPPDLNAGTFKLVRFSEETEPGQDPKWFFFPDQCRHCVYPLCKIVADRKAPGSIGIDSRTRAVIFNPEVKMSQQTFQEIREACPFDIPRLDEKTGGMNKCTMCNDRVHEGMQPACVQACPTGTMSFGPRAQIIKQARSRLSELRRTDGRAALIDPESVRVIFLVKDHPEKYHQFASAKPPTGMTRMAAVKGLVGVLAGYLGLS